jgi:hypothetical protein
MSAIVQKRMAQKPESDLITDPLTPKATHGVVEIKDPPESAMNLTADAAEISGLRLVDAADRARKRD